jgi:replicative DNA helicase
MQNSKNELGQILIEKYLPHNFLAEKIILSSLLISSEAIDLVVRTIRVETFYFKNHQQLYKAILEMYYKKIPIDILTLNTFLQDQGLLNKIGGTQILIDLINYVPNLIYLEDYLRLVQDKFLRRLLIKLGYQLINSGYVTNIPLELILNDLETNVFTLTNQLKTQKISSSAELLSNFFLQIKQNSKSAELLGLESGFYDLDAFTNGFQKSDLIIIAGRPSMGKTAFSLNITLNIIKKTNLPVLFFSFEMTKEQLIYRILTTETKINSQRLKSGNLYKEDWIKLNQTIQKISSLPLFIDDTANLTISDIKLKIKKIVFEQGQIGLVIIDYLQLMQHTKTLLDNRVQELSQITRLLKGIAREFQVPIIALSQLSRNVESRTNKRPILSDLRESGSIEQDADLVLMLYRDSYYNSTNILNDKTNLVELIISKHRNGPIGTVFLDFDPKYTCFSTYSSDL